MSSRRISAVHLCEVSFVSRLREPPVDSVLIATPHVRWRHVIVKKKIYTRERAFFLFRCIAPSFSSHPKRLSVLLILLGFLRSESLSCTRLVTPQSCTKDPNLSALSYFSDLSLIKVRKSVFSKTVFKWSVRLSQSECCHRRFQNLRKNKWPTFWWENICQLFLLF